MAVRPRNIAYTVFRSVSALSEPRLTADALAFGIEIRFVVGWKAFDLALIEIRLEGIAVFRRDPQGQAGNEELLAREPAAGVD
jgi:hypothetical protein